MKNCTVRYSVSSDAEAVYRLLQIIAKLHKDARPDMFPNLESKYTLEEVRQRLSKEDNGVFVSEIDGEVNGYIFCDIITEGCGSTLYIDDLCVDPSVHRQGIASKLMDRAREYAREKKCRMVMLNVWEFNESALAFYEKYGFSTRTRHLEMPL